MMILQAARSFSRVSQLAALGLKGNPSLQEIKEAYYRTAKSLHPDTSRQSSELFIKAKEAYESLTNNYPREKQSRGGHQGGQGWNDRFSQEEDEWQEIEREFERMYKQAHRSQQEQSRRPKKKDPLPRKGHPVHVHLELTQSEMEQGCRKKVSYKRMVACPSCETKAKRCRDCRGSGFIEAIVDELSFNMRFKCYTCNGAGHIRQQKDCEACENKGKTQESVTVEVQVPRAVKIGEMLKIEGYGSQGLNKWGDLLIFVKEKAGSQPCDLHHEATITIAEAVLGCTKAIKTALGLKELVVQPGSADGTVVVLSGEGHSGKDKKKPGDMAVTLRIAIPTTLSAQQRRFYEA